MKEIPESSVRIIRAAAFFGVNTCTVSDDTNAYLRKCSHLHAQTGTLIMFTRDVGHHDIGWFNPQHQRCLNLAISFHAPQPEQADDRLMNPFTLAYLNMDLPPAPFDHALARKWAKAILYPNHNISWHETMNSQHARALGIEHWRVFCNAAWMPIKPVGEVHSRPMTGWKSWEEANEESAER